MSDDFTKQNLEDCGLNDAPKAPVRKHLRSAVDHLTTAPESCGLSDLPKPEPMPPGRRAGPGDVFIKAYDQQAENHRVLADPFGESSHQQKLIEKIAGMIYDVQIAVKKQQEALDLKKKRQEQLGPYGTDVPIDRDGQDLGDFFQDREEAGSNGGPEGDTPNITQQGDRTKIFAIGTHVRTVDRYKVRGIGVVVSSANGVTTVDWGNGDEETYTSWELVPVEPAKPTGELDIATTKAFADGDMSKTGL